MTSPPPPLQAPGQGLPPFEAWISRWILFPAASRWMTQDRAIKGFLETGHHCLAMAKSVAPEKRAIPVLIDRLPGMEDSSRYWSVLMTLEHMLITGESTAVMIETLARGEVVEHEVKIDAVKPVGNTAAETLFTHFETFLSGYADRITVLPNLKNPEHRHEHPWFGELTAFQWLCLNRLHHQIHERQIKNIIAALP